MHVFPQLRKLEQKYSSELAVVGVHSAKFDAEKATQNVRQGDPQIRGRASRGQRRRLRGVAAVHGAGVADPDVRRPRGQGDREARGGDPVRRLRPADRGDGGRVRTRREGSTGGPSTSSRSGRRRRRGPSPFQARCSRMPGATGSSSPIPITTGSWSQRWTGGLRQSPAVRMPGWLGRHVRGGAFRRPAGHGTRRRHALRGRREESRDSYGGIS